MKKELKDFLHLYLGCEVVIKNHPNATLGAVGIKEGELVIVRWGNDEWSYADVSEIKPILRPLSSMTEEEILYCVGIAYNCVYGNDPEFIRTEMVDSNHEEAGIVCEEPGWRYGFTVNQYEIEFSANGSRLNIYTYEIIRYLLSKHFDLFGLLESGLAIESPQ